MRAIVNRKLYDTEKSEHTWSMYYCGTHYEIYLSQNGNVFAMNTEDEIVLDGNQLKEILSGKSIGVDAYTKIFGMPEEG